MIALLADVSAKVQVQAMIAEAVAQMGAIHAVVNNAASCAPRMSNIARKITGTA